MQSERRSGTWTWRTLLERRIARARGRNAASQPKRYVQGERMTENGRQRGTLLETVQKELRVVSSRDRSPLPLRIVK